LPLFNLFYIIVNFIINDPCLAEAKLMFCCSILVCVFVEGY
jgi:hypothetical protein